MGSYRFVTLDAFTSTPFAGNPCAVIPEAAGLTDDEMQKIARETNAPETAFIFPSEQADFRVRYYTPRSEIPFAGHPTIATVFLLAQEGRVPLVEPVTRLTVEFNIGVLPCFVAYPLLYRP
ncbi:MAG TPA: PhzF family phenazine biosynthesis isomerase, partial [Anaerolineaceae bacterium]|nr:PhzF family phenazine biosynthesis isomerase [Anaerolineaceae bacterium]